MPSHTYGQTVRQRDRQKDEDAGRTGTETAEYCTVNAWDKLAIFYKKIYCKCFEQKCTASPIIYTKRKMQYGEMKLYELLFNGV